MALRNACETVNNKAQVQATVRNHHRTPAIPQPYPSHTPTTHHHHHHPPPTVNIKPKSRIYREVPADVLQPAEHGEDALAQQAVGAGWLGWLGSPEPQESGIASGCQHRSVTAQSQLSHSTVTVTVTVTVTAQS